MIRKFKKIDNFGIFNGFDWEKSISDERGHANNFQHINIIYGRNYSGKTTLSRIIRALETGEISDKFEKPSFSIELADGSHVTQATLTSHNKHIRVFNEDFVRENLRFISSPEDSIEPFAILGEDNNKIEAEIEAIQAELGVNEEKKETGLYAQKNAAITKYNLAFQQHKKATDDLEKKLGDKATDRKLGIKYKPERFGDQNYNIQKLKADIEKIEGSEYLPLSDEQQAHHEKLISETKLQEIPSLHAPALNFENLVMATENLVTKKISESGKIEDLMKDAILNRWVSEGLTHHKDKRSQCGFCDNPISNDRWMKLEKHFDEESEQLQKHIDELLTRIEAEKNRANSLSIQKNLFYSKFYFQLDELITTLQDATSKFEASLNTLTSQLEARKNDILNNKAFTKPADTSDELITAWRKYESIRDESNSFTTALNLEQKNAQQALRLKEVSDYLCTIGYHDLLSSIKELKNKVDVANLEKTSIDGTVNQKEAFIASKKRELKDEEKGAKKVNDYLNNFLGHPFLKLEAVKSDILGEEIKRIRFDVIRDGKKAYHLSEGECSLLAFCYFLAKLDDIDTRDLKPIIWIDDPISSLDSNHIFFVYSLLKSEIVTAGKFEQLFVSTHNLDFLKYLKKLNGSLVGQNEKIKDYQKTYFLIARKDKNASIETMPNYLKEYITEFNYLFHQIFKCAAIDTVNDSNFATFYNFANNARKFLEIFLYYKYPDQGSSLDTLKLFFGEDEIPAVLTDRINNEYSHLSGVFERGAIPVEVPEMQTAAKLIIARLKKDENQYNALLRSVGETVSMEPSK